MSYPRLLVDDKTLKLINYYKLINVAGNFTPVRYIVHVKNNFIPYLLDSPSMYIYIGIIIIV